MGSENVYSNWVTIEAKDTTGKEVEGSYTWDVQELRGISVSTDGQITAVKSGTYHVRAINDAGQYSAWHAITVKNSDVTINKNSMKLTVSMKDSLVAKVTPKEANVKRSGKNILLSWTKVANASGYEIYGNHCSGKMKLISNVPSSQLSLKIKKMNGKSLSKKNKCYKFYPIQMWPQSTKRGLSQLKLPAVARFMLLR